MNLLHCLFLTCFITINFMNIECNEKDDTSSTTESSSHTRDDVPRKKMKEPPKIIKREAPLDISATIHHTLDTVNGLVGVLGGATTGLLFDLTGISLDDCENNFKGKDIDSLSCDEFFDTLMECQALSHIESQLKAAKKKYRKQKGRQSSATEPCSD